MSCFSDSLLHMNLLKPPALPSAGVFVTFVFDKSLDARRADFADEVVRLCRWPRIDLVDLLDFCDVVDVLRLWAAEGWRCTWGGSFDWVWPAWAWASARRAASLGPGTWTRADCLRARETV